MKKTWTRNYRLLKTAVKIQRRQMRYDFTASQTLELHGYTVLHCNLTMVTHRQLLAAAFRRTTGGATTVIDDGFFELPDSVQEFVLAHEAGHIALNHRENVKDRYRILKEGGVYNNEVEADRYAAERIGLDEAIACLFYLKTHITANYGPSLITDEFQQRAIRLLAWQ